MALKSKEATEREMQRAWQPPDQAGVSLAGRLPRSGAFGVGVVAAGGVLPVGLVVLVLRYPSHCSFSENKTRSFIFFHFFCEQVAFECFEEFTGEVQYVSITPNIKL